MCLLLILKENNNNKQNKRKNNKKEHQRKKGILTNMVSTSFMLLLPATIGMTFSINGRSTRSAGTLSNNVLITGHT